MAWLRAIVLWLASLFTPIPSPQPMPDPIPEPQNPIQEPPQPTTREILYKEAKASLGVDWTPQDKIPDDVACVDHLQAIYRKATGTYIGKGASLYSTKGLLLVLKADPRFRPIPLAEILPGDILVAATGEGNDPADHGHCWIAGFTHCMSNTSFGPDKGKWIANYTLTEIVADFVKRRGFKLHAFRPL